MYPNVSNNRKRKEERGKNGKGGCNKAVRGQRACQRLVGRVDGKNRRKPEIRIVFSVIKGSVPKIIMTCTLGYAIRVL